MLMNRSRAVTSKQSLMSDHHTSLISPITKTPNTKTTTTTTLISSFLGSPKVFFNGFFTKNNINSDISSSSETACSNSLMSSPTSILDTKNSSSFKNPFGYDENSTESATPSHEITTNSKSEHNQQEAIGLALIDSIVEEEGDHGKAVNRTVLFGSKLLKVQIPVFINPSQQSSSPVESPKSPADFGIKSRNVISQVSPMTTPRSNRDFSRQLSLKEMELSEDYTRVITHGPNPKTTHIYDDCVVESSCCDDDIIEDNAIVKVSDQNKKMEFGLEMNNSNFAVSPSQDFMSFCHTCKVVLGQDTDIFIYRGEKAFCSEECRCREMLSEGMKYPEFEWCFLGPS